MRGALLLVPIVAFLLLGALITLRIVTKKRIFSVLLVIFLLTGGLLVGWRMLQNREQVNPLADGEVYTVTLGSIEEVVEATGNLKPVTQTTLSFQTSGRLIEIQVATGDVVFAGEVLARLDSSDLELQLAQAQAQVDSAEANLNRVLAGAREEDINVARYGLSQAVASRDEQRVGLSVATEQARLNWVQAANALRDAQARYSQVYWDNRKLEDMLDDIGRTLPQENIDAEASAWRAVENAEGTMEEARLAYEAAKQREESSGMAANAQVASAQASLEKVSSPATEADVAVSQASVNQARAAYEIALAQLDKTALKAPFSGIVATVMASVYDQVGVTTPILVLLNPSAYVIDVEVDEVDISKIQLDQEVNIRFDAIPDLEVTGKVEHVALTPTTAQGVVTYRVRIRVANIEEEHVRSGMTANAGIITRQMDDVIIVPRRAVRQEDDQPYVEKVLPGNQLEKVPVELGLESPEYVQIISGLQTGDRIFVRGVIQRNELQQIIESSGPGVR